MLFRWPTLCCELLILFHISYNTFCSISCFVCTHFRLASVGSPSLLPALALDVTYWSLINYSSSVTWYIKAVFDTSSSLIAALLHKTSAIPNGSFSRDINMLYELVANSSATQKLISRRWMYMHCHMKNTKGSLQLIASVQPLYRVLAVHIYCQHLVAMSIHNLTIVITVIPCQHLISM